MKTKSKKLLLKTPLAELVDVAVLQPLQDLCARTNGISAIIRDLEGRPVTTPSYQNPFCELVMENQFGEMRCRASNRKAVTLAAKEHRVVKYVCHAGLTQFAAPIEVEGVCVGTIVMGDRPEGLVSEKQIAGLSRKTGVPKDKLMAALAEIPRWSDDQMTRAITFLLAIANAVAGLCYQGAVVRSKFEEINSLYEISKLLTGTLDLQQVLNRVARSATEVAGAKGCSIRLLDSRRKNLVVKSFYNLSQKYLDKGPVQLANSPIDKAALRGKVIQMPDMLNDERVLYPKEAEREGIRSGVSLGLISKGMPIGTLHLYSSEPRVYDQAEMQVLRSLANQAAVAIDNAQLYQQSVAKKRLDRELRVAGRIQKELLPDAPPNIPGLDIAAASSPCSDVGGDFYDFIPLRNNRTALIIADVAGKGVPAALLMASTRAGLRAHLENVADPREAVGRLNVNLYHDTQSSQFVSLFCSVFDEKKRILTYTNAGHNPPMVLRQGKVLELSEGGLVLGAMEEETYAENTLAVESGDIICFYTDGVTEAMNAQHEIFGTDRLFDALCASRETSADRIVMAIKDAVRKFVNGMSQSDDITMVIVRVE